MLCILLNCVCPPRSIPPQGYLNHYEWRNCYDDEVDYFNNRPCKLANSEFTASSEQYSNLLGGATVAIDPSVRIEPSVTIDPTVPKDPSVRIDPSVTIDPSVRIDPTVAATGSTAPLFYIIPIVTCIVGVIATVTVYKLCKKNKSNSSNSGSYSTYSDFDSKSPEFMMSQSIQSINS
jgi:hypothetical protein